MPDRPEAPRHGSDRISASVCICWQESGANQQLKTDIEKEQELERQRVDFFSAASHELKTPLTILKGHLAGMLNGVSGYENQDRKSVV